MKAEHFKADTLLVSRTTTSCVWTYGISRAIACTPCTQRSRWRASGTSTGWRSTVTRVVRRTRCTSTTACSSPPLTATTTADGTPAAPPSGRPAGGSTTAGTPSSTAHTTTAPTSASGASPGTTGSGSSCGGRRWRCGRRRRETVPPTERRVRPVHVSRRRTTSMPRCSILQCRTVSPVTVSLLWCQPTCELCDTREWDNQRTVFTSCEYLQ